MGISIRYQLQLNKKTIFLVLIFWGTIIFCATHPGPPQQPLFQFLSSFGFMLKVSLSRKQILKFSFEPKTERKYFCISALASKMGEIKKIMAHYHVD